MIKYSYRAAFTLVELSIVIIILALIVTAIISGKDFIRNAKLNRITKEAEQIRTMILSFRSQYGQYPGDIDHAYDYWEDACDSTPSNCNGDNDGIIHHQNTSNSEVHRLWQHLYLAEFTPRVFSGEGSGPSGSNSKDEMYFSDTNIAQFTLFTDDTGPSTYDFSADKYANWNGTLFVHAPSEAHHSPAFTAPESYYIDQKIDDGVANTGFFNGFGSANFCATKHKNVAGGGDYRKALFSNRGKELLCVWRYNLFP